MSESSQERRVIKLRKRSKSHFSPPLYTKNQVNFQLSQRNRQIGFTSTLYDLILIEKGFEVKFSIKTSVKVAKTVEISFFNAIVHQEPSEFSTVAEKSSDWIHECSIRSYTNRKGV